MVLGDSSIHSSIPRQLLLPHHRARHGEVGAGIRTCGASTEASLRLATWKSGWDQCHLAHLPPSPYRSPSVHPFSGCQSRVRSGQDQSKSPVAGRWALIDLQKTWAEGAEGKAPQPQAARRLVTTHGGGPRPPRRPPLLGSRSAPLPANHSRPANSPLRAPASSRFSPETNPVPPSNPLTVHLATPAVCL
jgi:hypothetical protein